MLSKLKSEIFFSILLGWVSVLIFPLSGNSQVTAEQMGLIDTVMSVREIQYSTSGNAQVAAGGRISGDKFFAFGSDGAILETLIYEKGRLYSTLKYEYDSLNRISGFKEYDAKGRLYISVTAVCDWYGELQSETYDRSLQKTYDDLRKEIDVEYHKFYQNLFTSIVYKYNVKGKLISKKCLKPNGDLAFRYEYTYDYKGYLAKLFYYNASDKLSWYEKMENDLSGRPILIKKFEKHRLVSTSTIEYTLDEKGNWLSRTEATEIPENIFGDASQQFSNTTIREIEYYTIPTD